VARPVRRPPLLGAEGRILSVVLTWVAAFVAFTLFYKGLPRGRVGWGASVRASLAAVLLWEAVRRLFGGIMIRSPAYGLLTGTLAGLVAFLLWIYFGVMVILLGAEIAAVLNGSRGSVRGPAGARLDRSVIRALDSARP